MGSNLGEGGVDSNVVSVPIGMLVDIGDNDQGAQTTNDGGKQAPKDVEGEIAQDAGEELSEKFSDDSEVKAEANIASGDVPNTAEPTPSPLAKTAEEILRPYTNLWTTVICLWVIQNAIVAAIAAHPQVSELHKTQPKTLIFATTLVAMGRLLLVPFLFFLSGFQLRWDLSMKRPWYTYARRTIWTLLVVVCLLRVKSRAERLYGTVPDMKDSSAPYYATKEGREALLNGPIYFSLAVLALDFSVLFMQIINRFTFGYKITPITDVKRYSKILVWILLPLMLWIQLFMGAIRLTKLPEDVQKWIYATNSADLHFPFLYPIAYYTGTLLPNYIKVIVIKHKNTRGQGLFSVFLVLFLFLTTVSAYFPDIIPATLDPRTRPVLEFKDRAPDGRRLLDPELAHYAYALWAYLTLAVVPEYTLAAVNYKPFFAKRSWGQISRHSNLQICYLMVIAVAPGTYIPSYIENVFLQGAIKGLFSIGVGCGAAVISGALNSALVKVWKLLFCRGEKFEPSPV